MLVLGVAVSTRSASPIYGNERNHRELFSIVIEFFVNVVLVIGFLVNALVFNGFVSFFDFMVNSVC